MDNPSDNRTMSLKLAEVLHEIGVNERIVKLRKKFSLIEEHFENFSKIFIKGDDYLPSYYFGSQSEGSTTPGLNSDLDILFCSKPYHVIQDFAEWKRGVINLLMVRDGTSPGYCILQVLQSDTPLPETRVVRRHFVRDDKGRILFKNTFATTSLPVGVTQQNGPACTLDGKPGMTDTDIVPALCCDSWPEEGRGWLYRQCIGNWPSNGVKRMAASKGCFLVPVSSKCNNLDEVEWRISTSIAERLMMFSLNLTQLMCYVIMKLISKTFLTMNGVSPITSFMLKCILFHCIGNTHTSFWHNGNLFVCVMECISNLRDCVQGLNCPHYIIPANNIMACRIDSDQQRYLLNVLNRLIRSSTDMFFLIEIDNLGRRLRSKLTNLTNLLAPPVDLPSQSDIESSIVFIQNRNLKLIFCSNFGIILHRLNLVGFPAATLKLVEGKRTLQHQYHAFSITAIEAGKYLMHMLCTLIGSILASYNVYTSSRVSPEAIRWLTTGFESDVSSSRLKLASAFYCAGDIKNAELTLRALEQDYTDVVVPVCGCHSFKPDPASEHSMIHVYRKHALSDKTYAFCVKFLRCEAAIIPQELRHELVRSTEDEQQNRSLVDKYWMDLAVVDSRPYLYFLQYKVYTHQGRVSDQRKALSNLLKTNLKECNMGHRETAWNLLGQCMEQEHMRKKADFCYKRSLKLRLHNNAANFHRARLRKIYRGSNTCCQLI